MAQTTLGVLYNDIRGKAGPTVFAHSKEGVIIRPLTQPANPRTPAQMAVRANMGKAAVAYKNPTPAQAAAWHTYAQTVIRHSPRNGRAFTPSAIAAFTALAAKFLQVSPAGVIP